MIYNKVLIVTKPEPDDRTNKIVAEIAAFCETNEVECAYSDVVYGNHESNILIVAVGGDGTMLGAMRTALRFHGAIVYGINTGTLGFLSEEYHNNINQTLSHIGRRSDSYDTRMGLTATIYVDGHKDKTNCVAMNELVLAPMTLQSSLITTVSINDKFVIENNGSGVLVATSTGSTAMAMSGNGAIVSPSTNIMQVVPLLSHTLTSRPVITSGRDTISLKAKFNRNNNPIEIYGDGICLGTYQHDEAEEIELRIKRHPAVVSVYRPDTWDFFNVLREKMKW